MRQGKKFDVNRSHRSAGATRRGWQTREDLTVAGGAQKVIHYWLGPLPWLNSADEVHEVHVLQRPTPDRLMVVQPYSVDR
jgi:hypothetical protein